IVDDEGLNAAAVLLQSAGELLDGRAIFVAAHPRVAGAECEFCDLGIVLDRIDSVHQPGDVYAVDGFGPDGECGCHGPASFRGARGGLMRVKQCPGPVRSGACKAVGFAREALELALEFRVWKKAVTRRIARARPKMRAPRRGSAAKPAPAREADG